MASVSSSLYESILLQPHTYDVVAKEAEAALAAQKAAVPALQKKPASDNNAKQQASYDDQKQALVNLAPVKAQLSPSDELQLFSSTQQKASDSSAGAGQLTSGQAVASDGSQVEVQIIKPEADNVQSASAQILALRTSLQQAATKYAATNDIIFSGAGVAQLAA